MQPPILKKTSKVSKSNKKTAGWKLLRFIIHNIIEKLFKFYPPGSFLVLTCLRTQFFKNIFQKQNLNSF
ncbi:hypothetical protein DDZ16_01245 [Marinilabilia rubra]|uniref:Uncharacterized protein n=1 Tax=Marinilabilia rubra TaxID=2162893 RepID=A0A2U2BDN4_9BACT|nr:hypothetical protein DDZ16_01245 [Marinilabilia rubra]